MAPSTLGRGNHGRAAEATAILTRPHQARRRAWAGCPAFTQSGVATKAAPKHHLAVTVAVYPGSFDPVHHGHLSIVRQAAGVFETVVVAVLDNPDKHAGMFSPAERVRLIEDSVTDLPNVRVVASSGLVVDVAADLGADVLIRAAHKERKRELLMAATNERLSGIPTVFFDVDAATAWVSSTFVRGASAGVVARDTVVPAPVAGALAGRTGWECHSAVQTTALTSGDIKWKRTT